MIDSTSLNNLFKSKNKQIGDLGGELFDLYRPDYTIQDNEPVLWASGMKFRMGVARAKSFAEPYLSNNSIYDIYGNRNVVQPGDIIIRGDVTSPTITYPAVTVSHIHDQRAMEGFRTARRCHIVNSYNEGDGTYDYVHKNVYFDMMGLNIPHGELTTNYAKDGQEIPSQRAIIFDRPLVNQEGMQLVETDYSGVPNGNRWFIEQIDLFGPFRVLTINANWRR